MSLNSGLACQGDINMKINPSQGRRPIFSNNYCLFCATITLIQLQICIRSNYVHSLLPRSRSLSKVQICCSWVASVDLQFDISSQGIVNLPLKYCLANCHTPDILITRLYQLSPNVGSPQPHIAPRENILVFIQGDLGNLLRRNGYGPFEFFSAIN